MIPIYGTPIGGRRIDVPEFLMGRDALVPFLRQDDLGVVAEVCRSFVFDNSAYTAWKQGVSIDFAAYIEWVRKWYRHPGFMWALIPDVIDGDEAANDELLAKWPDDLKQYGVPVWHLHESLGRLEHLARSYHTVALGSSGEYSSPNSKKWWARMREALNRICDEHGRPICKLHGLRMLDPRVFSKLPLSSADSTNAGRNNNQLDRYGMYVPPTAGQRAAVIGWRTERHNSAPLFVRTAEEVIAKYCPMLAEAA